jgi:nucleotide-binding universal stress UspA family protein
MDDVKVSKMVCAVDFSEYSDYALQYAIELASIFDAELKLLHVVELPFLPSYSLAGVPDLSLPVEQVEENAKEHMEELVKECRRKYERVTGDLRTGAPFLEIIGYARDEDADMIVVGTHGRSGLSHMLIGSVAEKIVRKAPCPVLTVKHPDHEFQMP